MNRYLGWGLVALVAAGVAASLLALPEPPDWTTTSEAALDEFLEGLADQQRLYYADAAAHFERAVELDPDFVAAKLFLVEPMQEMDRDAASRLLEEVLAAPTEGLSQRERLLVERVRAIREGRSDNAAAMVDAFLEEHPDDPHVLHIKAMTAWRAVELDVAERLFRRLIELEPNWVIGYNQLGYIAMRQGRFAEAEEYFTSYRFVAPDQANPHDSLGELYTIQGRFDEAVASLERALEIRPDFLASYDHLAIALVVDRRFGEAEGVARRLARQDGVPEEWLRSLDCVVRVAELVDGERWAEIVELADECIWQPQQGYLTVMVHRAAVHVGDLELALELESGVEQLLAKQERYQKWMPEVEGILDHMRGVRAAVAGDLARAEALLQAADERFEYREVGPGMLKLHNLMVLVEVRFAAGRDAEAHTLLSRLRDINPVLVGRFEADGFRELGLQRR